jgi:hypothetical protein
MVINLVVQADSFGINDQPIMVNARVDVSN